MKALLTLLTALGLTLNPGWSHAKETIAVYWPFGSGDGQALHVRAMLDQANADQNQYAFYLESAPGAGGLIAAQKTLQSKTPALLAHTSTFFVRPYLYKDNSYRFSDFQIVTAMSETPLALVANTNQNDKTMFAKESVKMGIAGLGTTSHIIALRVKQKHSNLLIVPYKTLADTVNDLNSNTIDMNLNFIRSAEQFPNFRIIGITGKNTVKNYQLLHAQGYDTSSLTIPLVVLAPASMDLQKLKKLNEILNQASRNSTMLQNFYRDDYATMLNIPYSQLGTWYVSQIEKWKKYTANVSIE
jgi:tripartite-type tricarboxylate transporter receptor subunit TctC